jgi:hypothetical protein
MAHLDDVKRELKAYNDTCRPGNLPPLTLSGIYSLDPNSGSKSESDLVWPGTWPNAGSHGVYFIFGPKMELLYVGEASGPTSSIGRRLSSYFPDSMDMSKSRAGDGRWSMNPTFVVTVAVDVNGGDEAPELERYLISRLQPLDNIQGKT